jgi:hypothetical protein
MNYRRLGAERCPTQLKPHDQFLVKNRDELSSGRKHSSRCEQRHELSSDAAKADFRRLRGLLDYRLNYDLVDTLAAVLFRLSPELGKAELALSHPPFVQAMLESRADWK